MKQAIFLSKDISSKLLRLGDMGGTSEEDIFSMSEDSFKESAGWHIIKDQEKDRRTCDDLLKRPDLVGGT